MKWAEALKVQPAETVLRLLGLFGCSEGSRLPQVTSNWAEGQRREREGVGRRERVFKEEDNNMMTDHL